MTSHQEKLLRGQFDKILNSEVIDIVKLRKLVFKVGCLDDYFLRSVVWKILLNYLPLRRSEWLSTLKHQRNTYIKFVEEVLIKSDKHEKPSSKMDVTEDDHPLNPNPKSKWSQYFQDNERLLQIDKDCRRLYPELDFFQRLTDYKPEILKDWGGSYETLKDRIERVKLEVHNVNRNWKGCQVTLNQEKKSNQNVSNSNYNFSMNQNNCNDDDSEDRDSHQETHWEVIERILFVYIKLNPGQGYVQGMNELIGPLYYIFYKNPDEREHVEADTFWCFTGLMSEIRDNFIKHLDNTNIGIVSAMNRLLDLLKVLDTALWLRLKEQDIHPQVFALRWIMILLAQDFILPDTLRLWDTLFADHNRFNFLFYVCCAMLVLKRNELLAGDYASNIKLIQNNLSGDLHMILSKATELAELQSYFPVI